jgi:hypothetical protein
MTKRRQDDDRTHNRMLRVVFAHRVVDASLRRCALNEFTRTHARMIKYHVTIEFNVSNIVVTTFYRCIDAFASIDVFSLRERQHIRYFHN